MTDAQSLNVRVACQVVAAGIFDDKARVTLAFSPMPAANTDTHTVDLARWPEEIANLLGITSASPARPPISIKVAPLGAEGWRPALASTPDDFDAAALPLAMTTRIVAADLDVLSVLWQEAMGGASGLLATRDLLNEGNDATREQLKRKPEGKAKDAERTPDIHGTGRADVAMGLAVERAAAIGFRGLRPGRPLQRSKALGQLARTYPSNLTLRALGADEEVQAGVEAWAALNSSRQRADVIAAARRDYEKATTSAAAIAALTQVVAVMETGESQAANMVDEALKAIDADTVPGFFPSEAVAAYRLASRPATRETDTRQSAKVEGAAPEDFSTDEMARRRFFALQSNPSLGRLFHFVVEAECQAANLETLLNSVGGFDEENIVDLRPEDGGAPVDLDQMPQPRKLKARFALLGVSLMFKSAGGGTPVAIPPTIWTLAKHRDRNANDSGQAGHFYPADREELDALCAKQDPRQLGACDSIDAIIDLRQTLSFGQRNAPFNAAPRYEILTLDAITSTGALDNKSRQQPPTLAYASETRRSAGLALADRRRQVHAIARYCASESQVERDKQGGLLLVLDAADLTVGYKLDVGVRSTKDVAGARSRWHTLMHRKVQYALALTEPSLSDFSGTRLETRITALYPDKDARREADDGLFHAPAALREWAEKEPGWESGFQTATAFAEDIVGAWRGDPPGLACGVETHSLDSADLPFNISYDLPTHNELGGALTPPPARYGWCYHLAARAVFLGGVSMPLERALGHYELSRIVGGIGSLVLPEARGSGRRFQRHERIEAPAVAVPDALFGTLTAAGRKTSVRLAGRYPAPQAATMVVRAVTDVENRLVAALPQSASMDKGIAGVGFDRRVLLIPAVPLDTAGLHGAFDMIKSDGLDHNLKLAEPRMLMDDEEVTAPDEAEQIPCPLAPEIAASVPDDGSDAQPAFWVEKRVAWKALAVASRPKGGLKGFDYRAAWGGLPIFRASAAEPASEAKAGQRVLPWRGQTDQGEILHRADNDIIIFEKDPLLKRTIHFSAVNAPSGAAVFRALPKGAETETERTPYFPDPGASGLIVAVWFKGAEAGEPLATVPVKLYPDDTDLANKPVPKGYPDVLPLVLDLVRVDIAPGKDRITVTGVQPYQGAANLKTAHVEVRIAPGEELSIGVWALPSKAFLTHIFEATGSMLALASTAKDHPSIKTKPGSVLEELAALATKDRNGNERAITGPGGIPIGYAADFVALADTMLGWMLKQPINEVAAVTILNATYAVDLPRALPSTDTAGLVIRRLNPDTIEAVLGGTTCPAPNSIAKILPADEDGATPVLLSGVIGTSIQRKLSALGPTVGAVEITAVGAAAARGRFDDPDRGRSRDDIARGLWPRPDGVTPMSVRDLYGFALDADGYPIFRPETVRLLRIEGFSPSFPPELLDIQQRARQADNRCPKPGDERLRAERPPAFPDARARYINIYAQAATPHGGMLATRYGEAVPNIVAPARLPNEVEDAKAAAIAAKPIQAQWLNATVRPSRPVGREPQPSFAWNYTPSPGGEGAEEVLIAHRSMMVRVRLARPWFSSGEGERLGLVLWPPNLPGLASADLRDDTLRDLAPGRPPINLLDLPKDGTNELYLQDADLGPGGAYVTRWGSDPTRQDDGLKGWLMSRDNFPDLNTAQDGGSPFSGPAEPRKAVFVRDVVMPLPLPEATGGLSPTRTMIVSLLTYAPRFDPQEETWYADIRIDPCSAVTPFVRLGLVRYQPHAAPHLQVSEPVTQWARILPDRELRVTGLRYTDKSTKTVCIQALVSGTTDSSTILPEMEFTLRRRRPDGEGDHSESAVHKVAIEPCCAGSSASWRCSFTLAAADYDKAGDQWFVTAAETELSRPGSYADEPRYGTAAEAPSARAGESFLVRMPLARLTTTAGKPPPEIGG